MSNFHADTERIWDDFVMDRTCNICELTDGKPAPFAMGAPQGTFVCSECFGLWYDGFTDSISIRNARLKDAGKSE